MCLYMWKIVRGLVPNRTGSLAVHTHTQIRRGLLCDMPALNNKAPASIITMGENSFIVRGPKLYNVMSKELREFTGTLDSFKVMLDKWLRRIPDKPVLPNYYQPAATNSILDQLAVLRAGRTT